MWTSGLTPISGLNLKSHCRKRVKVFNIAHSLSCRIPANQHTSIIQRHFSASFRVLLRLILPSTNTLLWGDLKRIVAAGEGFEPSSSGSKPEMLPVTPSRSNSNKVFRGTGTETRTLRLSGANTAYKAAALPA